MRLCWSFERTSESSQAEGIAPRRAAEYDWLALLALALPQCQAFCRIIIFSRLHALFLHHKPSTTAAPHTVQPHFQVDHLAQGFIRWQGGFSVISGRYQAPEYWTGPVHSHFTTTTSLQLIQDSHGGDSLSDRELDTSLFGKPPAYRYAGLTIADWLMSLRDSGLGCAGSGRYLAWQR
jgi:hypothetical protein